MSPTTITMTKGIIAFISFSMAVITFFKIVSSKSKTKQELYVLRAMLAIFTILSIYMTICLVSEVVDSLNGTGIEKEVIKLWCIMSLNRGLMSILRVLS